MRQMAQRRAARRGARIRCRSWTRWYAALCYCCTTTSSLAKLLFGQVPRERVVTLMLTAHPELSGEKNLGDIFEFGVRSQPRSFRDAVGCEASQAAAGTKVLAAAALAAPQLLMIEPRMYAGIHGWRTTRLDP